MVIALSGWTILIVFGIGLILFFFTYFFYVRSIRGRHNNRLSGDHVAQIFGFFFSIFGPIVAILLALNSQQLATELPSFNLDTEKYSVGTIEESKLLVILNKDKPPRESRISYWVAIHYLDKNGHIQVTPKGKEEGLGFNERLDFIKNKPHGKFKAEIFDLKRRICGEDEFQQWCNNKGGFEDNVKFISFRCKIYYKIGALSKEISSETYETNISL